MSAAESVGVGLDEAALGPWLEGNVAGFQTPFALTKFPAGQSNPTYRIRAASGDYVLRRQPFGKLLPSAHAVDREFRLLGALNPLGFPAPRPLALCEDAALVGAKFYVMELALGRSYANGALPEFDAATRTRIYEQLTDTLADLHCIDPAAVGLGDFGKPGNYFERQVGRWTKQYRGAETERLDDMERLIDYLSRTIPEQTRTSIVHGDYRIDNMIFDAVRPRVVAVLDWELSTTGDPLADFSYLMMNWMTSADGRAGVMGIAGPETGIPTLEAMTERYCEATGRDGIPALEWYFAFGLFRLASIVQGIKKRVIDGTATSAHAAGMADRVPALAAQAWQFAKEAGA